MLNQQNTAKAGIGLALSGGGFRAALFHVGSLWRLNELKLLGKISKISSVSGGSIVSGTLALAWNKLDFESNEVSPNFRELVADKIMNFCSSTYDTYAEGWTFAGYAAAETMRGYYDDNLFEKKSLTEIPSKPEFIFNATNLRSGKNFRFTKNSIGDYVTGFIDTAEAGAPANLISKAVIASSGFPPLLSPVVLETDASKWRASDEALFPIKPEACANIQLTDGGVYENLGLEPLWNSCQDVLVSNAGAPFDPGYVYKETSLSDIVEQLGDQKYVKAALSSIGYLKREGELMSRVMFIVMSQVEGLRLRDLISRYKNKEISGAYWGINTDMENYKAAQKSLEPLVVKPETRAKIVAIRTRLNAFTIEEQKQLINLGYAECDAAVRCYNSESLPKDKDGKPVWSKPSWPFPEQPM